MFSKEYRFLCENSNYASMKTESGHNHGKVFEDDREKVWIAPEVEVFVMSYKSEFLEE